MKVKDVMTADVAAVGQNATLKQVAALMVDRGVSGIPVVNADRIVVGVVTEADIVAKAASRPESAGLLGRCSPVEGVDDRHLAATKAFEAMTTPPINVDADASVAEAARRMVEHRVKRLPVVHDGRLLGIVSRADLVRAFARSDREIQEEIRNDVLTHQLWLTPDEVSVAVDGGRVEISGRTETRTVAELIEAFVWRVPGVVTVDRSRLTWETDDRAARALGRATGDR
jgi:CBS domain-containing protein